MRLSGLNHNVVFTRDVSGIHMLGCSRSVVRAIGFHLVLNQHQIGFSMVMRTTLSPSLYIYLTNLFHCFMTELNLKKSFSSVQNSSLKLLTHTHTVLFHPSSRVLLITAELSGIYTHEIAQNTRSERLPKSAAVPFEISL